MPKHLSGTAIEIWRHGCYINKATIGGILSVGGRNVALTVAHAFYSCETSDVEAFKFDESELGCLEIDESVCDEGETTCSDDRSPITQWPQETQQKERMAGLLESKNFPGPLPLNGDRILIGRLICISSKAAATIAPLD